jgi:hypothetical protein
MSKTFILSAILLAGGNRFATAQPIVEAVVNGASFAGSLAPGASIAIFGRKSGRFAVDRCAIGSDRAKRGECVIQRESLASRSGDSLVANFQLFVDGPLIASKDVSFTVA